MEESLPAESDMCWIYIYIFADVIRMYFSCVSTLYIYICDSVIVYAYAEWYSDIMIYCVLFVNSVELSRDCPNGKIVSYFQTSWS